METFKSNSIPFNPTFSQWDKNKKEVLELTDEVFQNGAKLVRSTRNV
jgi:hypothetical protein